MLDYHTIPDNWGIFPVLYSNGLIRIESYGFFVLLALVLSGLVYWLYARKNKFESENTIYLALAALLGGTIGSKIFLWIININEIISDGFEISNVIYGKTIVGGLIGGTIGVLIVKKVLKINSKKGNIFAPAIALGMSIGRIGCFLRGCCFGEETHLPWGIDFGDGVHRHPTQIYEGVFMFFVFLLLVYLSGKPQKPGFLFKLLMIIYFTFRLFLEFLKFQDKIYLDFTIFQVISILVLAKYIVPDLIKLLNNKYAGLLHIRRS